MKRKSTVNPQRSDHEVRIRFTFGKPARTSWRFVHPRNGLSSGSDHPAETRCPKATDGCASSLAILDIENRSSDHDGERALATAYRLRKQAWYRGHGDREAVLQVMFLFYYNSACHRIMAHTEVGVGAGFGKGKGKTLTLSEKA